MKSISPAQLIFYTSLGVAVIAGFSGVLVLLDIVPITWFTVFAFALFLGAAAYALNYIIVKLFLYNRIKVIYRAIRRRKLDTDQYIDIDMRKDLLTEVTKETESFVADRNMEVMHLRQQEQFRREFLGNLAHELKTPVFSIQGYVMTLLEGGLEDPNVNTKFLERASKAVDRITTLLEDLDEITQMEVDNIQLNQIRFDIVKLVNDVMDMLQSLAEEKQIEIKLAKAYDPIFVMADKSKIEQVLVNLIKNSIAYGNEKGETIIRFNALDSTILVEVSDNGPGIEAAELPRLFERFYRVEKSRNRNEGGTGLGLAIARTIVEAHGQTINVRSTVGIGSTFSFTLKSVR
jgi:two-component system, OmpR family, phosphate regulon sensor histidine kinase PhoR